MNEMKPIQTLNPALTPNENEEIARRAFLALDALDCGSRRKLPTLLTIFRLYCIEELTVAQIARKCRCSKGTVSNRLKLLHATTGVEPERLRKVSPYVNRFQHDRNAAIAEYARGPG